MSAIEESYSPFTGHNGHWKKQQYQRNDRGGGGERGDSFLGKSAKVQPVDWGKAALVPNKWKVLDANAIRSAAEAKKGRAQAEQISEVEARKWRDEHTVTIFGEGCPPPATTFEHLGLSVPSQLLKKLTAQNFTAPTPVQAQTWPILLTGRDLVGVAKTGSGKTLGFMIPALVHITVQEPLRPGDGPMVVVLAPTRELAQQIEQETRKVILNNVQCGCIYGGAPKGPQLKMLQRGVHILVATPGRLIDFLGIKRVNLLRVTYLVLDEADRMLDMGFEPQVRTICSQVRPDRQTVMFSATWPKEIQRLAAEFQRDWIRINVGSTELLANKDVTQHFILTQESTKLEELRKLMDKHRNERVLVFCKMKRTADNLEWQLKRWGYDAMAIHGDKEQHQRDFILSRFRKDPQLCLVATDVAARGLDIKELETVINYDFPMQIDDYVHRVGRTGRAGAKGEAFTLITKREQQISPSVLKELIAILERAQQQVPEWMREWYMHQPRYQVMKRNRSMSNFGKQRHIPSLYNDRRPSPNAGGRATGHGGGTFGLSNGSSGAAPFSSTTIPYKKFDDSDDDVQPPKRKRA
ncbi:DEAD DEAH box helicase Helicase conserved C terminal domain [Trypanosoma vivax]|uniref:Probable eukaryotic initiation factor 4A n=1 Tax=Trypanosoma vivax (strain Y486) TaxID=1055687 RepID=G0U6V6_TRYVY|nr:putative DEAD box RNA helicase [Trypanosoma vivax]KAH8611843.1 DEAD DEAH box helicase Helicase conserved C terminal domain [Trypanosoma vivax]CCC51612.1 putative DEAD box RNA helicase [Trypanosoma vivax Y486]